MHKGEHVSLNIENAPESIPSLRPEAHRGRSALRWLSRDLRACVEPVVDPAADPGHRRDHQVHLWSPARLHAFGRSAFLLLGFGVCAEQSVEAVDGEVAPCVVMAAGAAAGRGVLVLLGVVFGQARRVVVGAIVEHCDPADGLDAEFAAAALRARLVHKAIFLRLVGLGESGDEFLGGHFIGADASAYPL